VKQTYKIMVMQYGIPWKPRVEVHFLDVDAVTFERRQNLLLIAATGREPISEPVRESNLSLYQLARNVAKIVPSLKRPEGNYGHTRMVLDNLGELGALVGLIEDPNSIIDNSALIGPFNPNPVRTGDTELMTAIPTTRHGQTLDQFASV
jgi:hypothetical protein